MAIDAPFLRSSSADARAIPDAPPTTTAPLPLISILAYLSPAASRRYSSRRNLL
jgi:hypothetical protein